MIKINTPLNNETICSLSAGDKVLISGVVYTARDKAHERFIEVLKKRDKLPVNLEGQVLFYAGPAPAKPGKVIGSIGPTTSGRMDLFTPYLLSCGLKGMIGKGSRSESVKKAIRENKAVYFVATGGIAALLSKHIKRAKIIAYEDLGPEAVYELELENFPVVVGVDCRGKDFYVESLKEK
ncbi:Fe-S-containing hydro-lyase [Candidatus Oleimmundimicrobium sp.]|uniref:Fe-S-containing hydro-lyase n=1 Tax=Candidatus Oleimmundimicrobium sp. TaxID=3060597 RepID=UPI00271CB51C|nr:Fe-S-containing hydro-lyase [Candidatus Oleimmundimicrobium sp.]MDO8886424.1 Fe-S-containing hydro-lyase [Candidatus Oleimmundimicrobium sp.]